MTPATDVDLRRDPIATVRQIDFRATGRSFAADEAAIWDRFAASVSGLDDAAWRLPGAAPSDAGGPAWSLLEHVAHVVDWQEIAIDYLARVAGGGAWPTDDDYDGGDFDRFNEGRRGRWATLAPRDVRSRLQAGHDRLLTAVARLDADTIRSDEAWGWVFMVLHGHQLDHLGILDAWGDHLRVRQMDGDPFVADPRVADRAAFQVADTVVQDDFDDLLAGVPAAAWTTPDLSPGWTLIDHVGHLADWMVEGVRAIGVFRSSGTWESDPDEGVDRWNAIHVEAARAAGPTRADVRRRYDVARAGLLAAIDTLSPDELRSADGWSWAYDCAFGHVRKHLALLGPWAERLHWPRSVSPTSG